MRYRVFDSYEQAAAAERQISHDMGYAKPSVNAASGAVVPGALTVRWAVPQQIRDGRWVFESPDEDGVEPDSDWFSVPDDVPSEDVL